MAKYPRRTIALGPPFDDGTVPGEPPDLSLAEDELARVLAGLEYAPGVFLRGEDTLVDFARRLVDAGVTIAPAPPLDVDDDLTVEALAETLYRYYPGPSRDQDWPFWQTRARNMLAAVAEWRARLAERPEGVGRDDEADLRKRIESAVGHPVTIRTPPPFRPVG